MAKYTKEQIEKYRAEYQAEIHRLNDEPGGEPLSAEDLDIALNRYSDESIIDFMRQEIPPKNVAYIQMFYS